MKLLVCIDDTDNLDSKGTGAIADDLKDLIAGRGFGLCGLTTRHQLLLHDDIPYTSHNSSMCFDVEVANNCLDELIPMLYERLKSESAPGSDPGIAVVETGRLCYPDLLRQYGLDAKRSILTKESAYKTAERTNVYLAETGGDGMGVIGALAGAGLRLGGNDGEVKGGLKEFKRNNIYTVEEFLSAGVVRAVSDTAGNELAAEEKVLVAWKAKPMLIEGRFVLIVKRTDQGIWSTMEKNEMRRFRDRRLWESACLHYDPDVPEEQVDAPLHSCLNCRFRRWTGAGFLCVFDKL